ncbi:MarR family winged helix-turn-helix transcriptional regulator [Streptomyces halstedii]|uniref:MarR family winged helix-turn-helix transcriptional regulator n=1 Tax=Streptomyces TaxID=1883 RepID=UPI0004B2CFC2|nr:MULTISPECIES: MarR family transcriptional regulator [unclassified Streptomyces]MYY14348.1 MarR family transcriptional regulator [Streptomyces sp. SID4912]SCE23162.1 DNA-binding transcriptional regulator, MarR family [Streptomyces sp. DpondAA-D4]
MTTPDAAPSGSRHEAVHSASFITELLDVMWDNARNSTAGMTAPGSTSQLRLMYVVDREDGIRMRTVCERLASAAPTVTRMCDRLQATGFLERLPSPDNGREITLRLTPTGKRHLQRIREQRDTMLHQAIGSMSPTERRALALGLAGLHRQLNTAHPQEHRTPVSELKRSWPDAAARPSSCPTPSPSYAP